jgi:hypothetical protein
VTVEGKEIAQICDSSWNMKELDYRENMPLQKRKVVNTKGFLKY